MLIADKRYRNIELLILDVDGVLTNGGKVYDSNHNTAYKEYYDKDFTAIKAFQLLDIPVVFCTSDPFNFQMAEKRNVPFYLSRTQDGKIDKVKCLYDIESDYLLEREHMAYIGDDGVDIPILNEVGFPFVVNDAPLYMKHYERLANKGGSGVVAELLNYFLIDSGKEFPNVNW